MIEDVDLWRAAFWLAVLIGLLLFVRSR